MLISIFHDIYENYNLWFYYIINISYFIKNYLFFNLFVIKKIILIFNKTWIKFSLNYIN